MLADINDSMLKMGREKLRNIGIVGNVEYVQANAEALPLLIIPLTASPSLSVCVT
nr:Ubiquinone/menaquinone biosynthesis methyltransferase ubiE [Klebsiella pneumoniae]